MAERDAGMSPQVQRGSNVAIKLFQYQPGLIQVKAWDDCDLGE